MTVNDLLAAAPELMKKLTAASLAVASSLEPTPPMIVATNLGLAAQDQLPLCDANNFFM
jgi:hypothetical protein